MKLIALLIGLIVERLATQLFHLRELRRLDAAVDAGFRFAERFPNWPSLLPVILLAALLVLPIALAVYLAGDALFGFPYLIFAVVVLFFSLGPKDIGEEIDDYCTALADADGERIASTSKTLIEQDPPGDPDERTAQVEEAVCIQANNRLFAVVFWFVLMGPLGAWSYRVTDLIRRRAVFRSSRDKEDGVLQDAADASGRLHGWLAWIPARLTAIGYALAGSFDGAISNWREPAAASSKSLHEQSEALLARVGTGALALHAQADESATDRAIRGANAAKGLVARLLFIWAAVIAAMTLYGWSV